MASIVRSLFIPSVYFSIIIYALLLFLNDLAFVGSVATLGLIVSLIFLLNFSLPPNDKSRIETFLAGPLRTQLENGDENSVNNEAQEQQRNQKGFVVAHRTLALDAPENSASGITQAAKDGLDAVEFDVRLSKDGIPVLFHDSTVNRITGKSGKVTAFTLAELQDMDISYSHLKHNQFKGERVVTLAEAISKCLQYQLKIFIDVKVTDPRMLRALLQLFESNPELYDQALVVCFSPIFLYQLRRKDPCVLTGLIWRPRMASIVSPTGILDHGTPAFREAWRNVVAQVADLVLDFTYHTLLWHLCGAAAILAHKDAIHREYLRTWRQHDMAVLAWPVNDPVEKLYFGNILKVAYLTDTTCSYHR